MGFVKLSLLHFCYVICDGKCVWLNRNLRNTCFGIKYLISMSMWPPNAWLRPICRSVLGFTSSKQVSAIWERYQAGCRGETSDSRHVAVAVNPSHTGDGSCWCFGFLLVRKNWDMLVDKNVKEAWVCVGCQSLLAKARELSWKKWELHGLTFQKPGLGWSSFIRTMGSVCG